jgi:hypothetical protein
LIEVKASPNQSGVYINGKNPANVNASHRAGSSGTFWFHTCQTLEETLVLGARKLYGQV